MSNPILKAFGEHLAAGDKVANVEWLKYSPPQEFACVLTDRTEHKYVLENTSHEELVEYDREARAYFATLAQDWPKLDPESEAISN